MANKWIISIIAALAGGPLRYTDLHRAIGPAISQKVLTDTLRLMQQNRLLVRREATTTSVSGTYELTESATAVRGPLAALARWHARATTG